jgi:hypothetical protein
MRQFAKPSGSFRTNTICAATALVLASCAGRAPQPVAVVQPEDRYLDCTAIQAEIVANNKTLQGLASEEGGKVAQNVAAGVAGLFIWPLWFAMDFQGAASKEEAALQSRQEYLATLALQRGCVGSARTVTAVAPAPAQAAAPVQAAVPLPTISMTPCGEDRPCSARSTGAY